MIGRPAVLLEPGSALRQRDLPVTERVAAPCTDCCNRLGACQQPQAGPLITLADVAGVRQRRDRDDRSRLDVEERLLHAADRQDDLATQHRIEQEARAEVLREPARAQERLGGAGLRHRLRRARRLLLASAGQHMSFLALLCTVSAVHDRTVSTAPGTANPPKVTETAPTSCSADAHVARSSPSKGGTPERAPSLLDATLHEPCCQGCDAPGRRATASRRAP